MSVALAAAKSGQEVGYFSWTIGVVVILSFLAFLYFTIFRAEDSEYPNKVRGVGLGVLGLVTMAFFNSGTWTWYLGYVGVLLLVIGFILMFDPD